MLRNYKYITSILLVLSFSLMVTLVSGDYIDSKIISIKDALVLDVFYTFITLLMFISILNILFIFEEKLWAYFISTMCGVFYFFIYLVDLGSMLPSKSKLMPNNIIIIETLGLIASILLITFSVSVVIKYIDIKVSRV